MRPRNLSLLAVAGAVLLSYCGSNNPKGGGVQVTGKVMNTRGAPSPDVLLVIKSGASFSVTTHADASGNFTVANVPTPYDVIVLHNPTLGVTVSVGLTSANPTVLNLLSPSSGSGSPDGGGAGTLSGQVTGGIGLPSPQGYRTSVLFASPEVQTDDYLPLMVADAGTGDYTTDAYNYDEDPPGPIYLSWSGPATTTGTVYALQWLKTNIHSDPYIVDVPKSYSGFGFKENVSLTNQSTVSGQDIALIPVSAATFAGTCTAPAGYRVDEVAVVLKFGSRGLMSIVNDMLPTESFSYPIPNIPDTTLVLGCEVTKSAPSAYSYSSVLYTGLAGGESPPAVTATPPPAAELSVPLDGATGVTTATPLSWTAVPGVVHILIISTGRPSDQVNSTTASYVFLTSETSVTIPDLTSVGLTFPASTAFNWMVFGVGPFDDVEAASANMLGEHHWPDPFNFNVDGANLVNSNTGGFVTASLIRSFTTAP